MLKVSFFSMFSLSTALPLVNSLSFCVLCEVETKNTGFDSLRAKHLKYFLAWIIIMINQKPNKSISFLPFIFAFGYLFVWKTFGLCSLCTFNILVNYA